MAIWKEELNNVKQCPQRQDSLTDQLKDLYQIANKFGLYDAADFVRKLYESNWDGKVI